MKNVIMFKRGLYGIALRRGGDASFQPWVTHQFNTNLETHGGGYYWGHYFKDSCEALDDFMERVLGIYKSFNGPWSMEFVEEEDA